MSSVKTIRSKGINALKPTGNYMYKLLQQLAILQSVFPGSAWLPQQTGIISLNSINQLIVVMVKCWVLFDVRT
jgi:hypothetical protein